MFLLLLCWFFLGLLMVVWLVGGGGGGVKKTLRNTNGGSCQMLTFDDKGGGGQKNPQTCLRNTWIFPWQTRVTMKSVTIVITIISRKTVAGKLHGSHKAVARQSQTVERQS